MSEQQQKGTNWVAVITMMFIYGMISFVTNLAAPMGSVWKYQPGIDGSNMWGMMGNMMNFLAYLFMGIPAGKMLTKCGYKKTALIAIATGFVGVGIQFLSGKIGICSDCQSFALVGGKPFSFYIYLLGAFVCGFSVCMLNMVVNPMLNLLGGGGNRGNQLNMIGTTFNSVCGTATPILVGALIGEITKATKVADVNLVMFIALAVFAAAFVVLTFIPIANPEQGNTTEDIPVLAPLKFRHCLLGVIAIFMYVGIEIGIPATMNNWLADKDNSPLKSLGYETQPEWAGVDKTCKTCNAHYKDYSAEVAAAATGKKAIEAAKEAAKKSGQPFKEPLGTATVAGMVAGTYWFLMLIGRTIGAFIGGKVSSRVLMTFTTFTAITLICIGVFVPATTTTSMPVFTGKSFVMATVPLTALLFALCGLMTSIMWPSTFNLATEKLGKYTAAASGLFMVMVVGGGVLPLVQNGIADKVGYMISYAVPVLALAYMFVYSAFLSKPPKNIDELVK
jgi:FHS family L-fucose permease-like MFS transporter